MIDRKEMVDALAFVVSYLQGRREDNIAPAVLRAMNFIRTAPDPEDVKRLVGAVEMRAAERAYAAGLGATEWKAFLTPDERDALLPFEPSGNSGEVKGEGEGI